LLRVLSDKQTIECPTCGVRGNLSIDNGKINVKFEDKTWKDSRFSTDVSYNHYTYHIAPSKDFFLRTKEERKAKSQKYKEYLAK
jgi:hypothetical protein